jgi:hypothetical protein
MWGCIVETDVIRKNLETRFKLYPTDTNIPALWGEPGLNDRLYGMPDKTSVYVKSEKPCVVFVHPMAMGSVQLVRFRRRYGDPLPENKCYNLEGFGNAKELIDKYWK